MGRVYIDTEIKLFVGVECEFDIEKKSFYSKEYGSFQPGEFASIKKIKVTTMHKGTCVDITEIIDSETIEELKTLCLNETL